MFVVKFGLLILTKSLVEGLKQLMHGTKVFSNLIRKKMGKTTQDLIKKNPEIKKNVDNVNKAIDDFNKSFRKSVGKKKADQIEREVDLLFK